MPRGLITIQGRFFALRQRRRPPQLPQVAPKAPPTTANTHSSAGELRVGHPPLPGACGQIPTS